MNFNAVEASQEATNELQKCLRTWKHEMESDDSYHNEFDEATTSDRIQILEELFLDGADLKYLERERGFVCITHVYWSIDLIKFFVDKGTDVNSKNENGDTVLHLAISHGNWALTEEVYDSQSLIKFLLYDLSADPNIANLQGDTPLFVLLKGTGNLPFYGREFTFTRKVARMLLEKGAKIATINGDGESMLHLRISCFAGLLIEAFDGDIDARTSSWLYSKTPLMAAASLNNVKLSKMLIERGAFVNAVDLQGYTPLHHSVATGVTFKCPEFLVNMGADLNAKSASGKDVYDISICHNDEGVFTYGATPIRQAELYEIAGAVAILKIIPLQDDNPAFEMWDKVVEICEINDLQPSPEFLDNFDFLRQIEINTIMTNEEILLSAMNNIPRLSRGTSKFWNILSLLGPSIKSNTHSPKFWYSHACFLQFLEIVSKELEQQTVEDLTSIEQADFRAFYSAFNVFDKWITGFAVDYLQEAMPPIFISVFHSFVNLAISCFNKLLRETKKNILLDYRYGRDTCPVCLNICHSLMLLQLRFGNVITEAELNENERLLRNLFELDRRNNKGNNSLIHLILEASDHRKTFESDIVLALLDFDFVNVTGTRNGYELLQCVNWPEFDDAVALKMFEKMAARGSHVDVTNVWYGPALRELLDKQKSNLLFKYDSLQCTCARFLAGSLVPYRSSWLPKRMIDFIDEHCV